MTDIEFLLSERTSSKKIVGYFWNNGYFKGKVLQKMLTKAKGVVCSVSVEEFNQQTILPSLLQERHFFVEIKEETDLVMFLKSLHKIKEDRVFFSCPMSLLEKIEKESFPSLQILKEVEKTKTAIEPLILYSLREAQVNKNLLTKFPLLKQNLEELFTKCENVFDFLQKTDFSILTCLEVEKDKIIPTIEHYSWNSTLFRNILPKLNSTQYFQLQENLFFFLSTPNSSTKEALFIYLEQEFEDSRTAIAALYKAIFDLFEVNAKFEINKENLDFRTKYLLKFSHIPLENILQFLIRLSEYEVDLNTQGFLSILECMLEVIKENIKK